MDRSLIIFLIFIALLIIGFIAAQNFFPLAKNKNEDEKKDINNPNLSSMTIEVAIPCSGHAALIKNYLKQTKGIENVYFKYPNYFSIYYDSDKTTKEKILSIDIFLEYPAKEISE